MIFLADQLHLITTQFHWLRPLWLLALIPTVVLSVFLWRQKRTAHQWQHLIAPELLPFLIDRKTISVKKSLWWALMLAWLLSTLALAGPSWVKRPTPVEKNQHALVVLLDLSLSMYSEDIKPSRIVRARLKIADILRDRKDGQTALVVYAGEAHTVTPLSDDSATLINLLPSLQPNIMPLQGSNAEDAVARGIQLLYDAGVNQGDLLLITDGVVPEAFSKIRELLNNKNIHLNILGVGTDQPVPIATGGGGFLRDKQGTIITAQLNSAELLELAQHLNGHYRELTNTSSDINFLTQYNNNEPSKNTVRDFDQWFDQGHWLVFLLLPIVLLSFRRGLMLMFVCLPLLGLTPSNAQATDLWLTKDQQGERALTQGDAKKAKELFTNPEWKAAAQYRAGDYAAAAETYAAINSTNAHYNRGNALAKAGKLPEAMKAYDEALTRDSTFVDAQKNRDIVEALLKKQQEQNQKNDNKENQQKDSDKKDQNKNDTQDKNQDDKNKQQEEQNKNEQDKKQQQHLSAQNASAQNEKQQELTASAQASTSAASTNNAQAAQTSSAANGKQQEQKKQQAAMDNLTEEQKQALEQWLRRVPDDPGGLLRNKFNYQYQQNRQKKADGEFESPNNNADQRW
jgi:Ca-activated chloride channel homolog